MDLSHDQKKENKEEKNTFSVRLYIENEKSLLLSQTGLEKTFGLSTVFIGSTPMESGGTPESTDPAMLIKETIHILSCGYEENTDWGKELGWIYGSVIEDIFIGFKMQCKGWRSIYCMYLKPSFKRLVDEYVTFMKGVVSAPLNLLGTACRKALKKYRNNPEYR